MEGTLVGHVIVAYVPLNGVQADGVQPTALPTEYENGVPLQVEDVYEVACDHCAEHDTIRIDRKVNREIIFQYFWRNVLFN